MQKTYLPYQLPARFNQANNVRHLQRSRKKMYLRFGRFSRKPATLHRAHATHLISTHTTHNQCPPVRYALRKLYSDAFQRSMTHLHVSLLSQKHCTRPSRLPPPVQRAKAPRSLSQDFLPFQQPKTATGGEFVRSECGRSRGRVRERGVRARERRGRGKWAMRERGGR